MRILLSSHPAAGHVNPLIPIARALRRDGHEPVFATSASFCPQLARAGFEAEPVGVDWLEAEAHLAFPDLIGLPPTEWTTATRFRPVFTAASVAMLPDLSRLIADTGASAVVHEGTELGGRIAAEVASIPPIAVSVGYQTVIAEQAADTLPSWQSARALFGLPADGRWSRLHPFLCLDSFPDTFQPHPPDDYVDVRLAVRPEPPNDEPAPAWLDELPDRPTVYVSFGTVFNRAGRAFELVFTALADLDLNVIAAVGNADVDNLRRASNIHIERHVPQHAVIAAADLVITHAGYNTVVETLAHGVPMLTMPLGADQPYNAFRIVGAGAGLRLSPDAATPEDVRDGVASLLESGLYRANAQRLQREIVAMASADEAALAIATIASTGEPFQPSPARGRTAAASAS